MFKKLLLLLWLPIGWVQAQHTVIAGKFPYQSKVPFSIAFIFNQITFEDEWGKISDTSDAQGYFKLKIPLNQPSILRFSKQESIQLYLRPGDSLWIEMINGRNLRFEGTVARENRLLHYFNVPPFIPTEIEVNPELYSPWIDSLAKERTLALTQYETDEPDQGFVRFFQANSKAAFLSRKMSVFKKLDREGLEGVLMDRVRRQLQEPIIDETRSSSYLYVLRELFQLEVSQIMGQEIPPFTSFSSPQYPPGYEELYTQHWHERLAGKPNLYRYFELEEYANKIRDCSKPEQLPSAAAALAQIKKASEYPGLFEVMQEIYATKVIQYQLRKLPDLEWKDEQGRNFNLAPDEKRTLVVFWNALTTEGVKAFQRFQDRPSINQYYAGNSPDTLFSMPSFQRMIWVQVGGDAMQWKAIISQLPNRFQVQHCQIERSNDIKALEPYLFNGKLPVAFTLQEDLSIGSMTDQPTAIEMFRSVDSRGWIIGRPPRK